MCKQPTLFQRLEAVSEFSKSALAPFTSIWSLDRSTLFALALSEASSTLRVSYTKVKVYCVNSSDLIPFSFDCRQGRCRQQSVVLALQMVFAI